jgi:galactokinase
MLWDKVAAALAAGPAGGQAGEHWGFFVPGRIEVLGKHTDYAGGRSLVAAVERGFRLLVLPRGDGRVRITDALSGQSVEFPLAPDLVPRGGHWSNYPMTVARRLARNFPGLAVGAHILFASDLPPAAGLSSSSALIVGVFLALAQVNALRERPDFPAELHEPHILGGYLGTIENGQGFGRLAGDRGVGTFGGSEDHTAILCAEPGRLGQFAYCPVRHERSVPMPPDYLFAIGSSGIVAEKTGAAQERYNRAAELAAAAAREWRRQTGRDDPHLAAAISSAPDAAGRLRAMVQDSPLAARVEHFLIENEEIVPAAGDALAAGDVPRFGRLVDRSQQAAEHWLGNQIPETALLAATARRLGAAAASAFGAGFGGSVWALVERERAERFLAAWSDAYRREFPGPAALSEFFLTDAGPPARTIPTLDNPPAKGA